MKKLVYLMLVLFVYGGMCKAESLSSVIMADQSKIRTATPGAVRDANCARRVKGNAENYWVKATNLYKDNNGYLRFDPDGQSAMWPITMEIDGTNAIISGLCNIDQSGHIYKDCNDVVGTYDEAGKRIIINAPAYERGNNVSTYTSLGTVDYYGDICPVVLFCGDYAWYESEGQYGLETKGRLILNISDDDQTLTPDHGFGIGLFYSETSFGGFLSFYSDTTLEKFAETPKLCTNPEEFDYTDLYIYAGGEFVYPFTISNVSNADTSFEIYSADSESLTAMTVQQAIKSGETVYGEFTFNPAEVGEYETIVYISYDNGKVMQVPFKASVKETPHYENVVKEGEFLFSTSAIFPFEMVTDEAGNAMATSTNYGDETESVLYAYFTVPDGCTGVINMKGNGYATMPNSLYAYLDKGMLVSKSEMSPVPYEIDESQVVEAGQHVLELRNYICMDWHQRYPEDNPEIKFYLTELSLKIETTSDNAAAVNPQEVNFGRHYFDKLSVTDTREVTLINTGRNKLQVTAVKGDDNFTAIIPEDEIYSLESVNIPIVFTGKAIGEYEGTIYLVTTAGELPVQCKASCEQIIYDYSPIVSQGDFSFNTSLSFPFEVIGSSAYSTIGRTGTDIIGLPCWLEASCDIPEGKEGLLDWTGYNSSWDYFVWMDEYVLTDGTIIYIDGEQVGEYAGETTIDAVNVQRDYLILTPGRHTVRFEYIRKSSEPYKGDDKVEVSNLSLELFNEGELSGMEMLCGADAIGTDWYNLDGVRLLKAPEKGLAIKVVRYSDGSYKTYKVMFN